MATGDLQNAEELDFLNKKAELTSRLIKENKLPKRFFWQKRYEFSKE